MLLWDENNDDNIWEHTGLFEGDIMIYSADQKNGIIDPKRHWPNATIPFYIDEEFCKINILF